MEQSQVKDKILKVLKEDFVGVLSTVENDKPYSRYMTFFNDELTLYTATSAETEKVDEIEKNRNVHILLGYNGEGFGDSYVEISGTSEVSDSPELKKKVWNDHLKSWFDGPEDPTFVVLQIKPSTIRLMNNNGEPPEELTL